MSAAQSFRDFNREIERLRQRQRSARETRRERLPVNELHDEKVDARLVPDVVNRADVGMAERGDRPRFALKALPAHAIGLVLGKNLDRNIAIEPGITGPVDLAHPSGTQRRLDLIGPEPRAGVQRHEALGVYVARADPSSAT